MKTRGAWKMLVVGGLLTAVGLSSLPAAAQANFIRRPTQPYDCDSLAAARGADGLWYGRFHGTKQIDEDDGRFPRVFDRRANVRACFTDQTNCRNWLYNMQSEYTGMVYRAECQAGLPR